jgi:hypothetical protein
MSGFIKGEDRFQATLFPERLDDYVAEDSAVRVIDVFLDDLDLSGLGLVVKRGRIHLVVKKCIRPLFSYFLLSHPEKCIRPLFREMINFYQAIQPI